MQCAVTVSLVPEAKGGPFVFWGDLESACQTASSLGFHGIEIFPRSAEELDARLVKGVLNKFGLRLAAMGTGAGWVVQRLRLTDPDLTVRRRAQSFVSAIIDFAGTFGAPAIIGSMQGRHDGEVTREQALEWLGESLEQLAPRANAHGVPLLIEPLNRYETNLLRSVSESLDFLRPLRTQNVKLLCDLFHMNIEEATISGALELAAEKIGHVHFADSNRQAIGLGHTDAVPVVSALKKVGYSGFLSAEILPMPDSHSAAAQTIASFKRFIDRSS